MVWVGCLALRIPGVRGFTAGRPGAASESIERLYALLDEAEEKHATLQKLRREGDPDAVDYAREHVDLLARREQLNRTADRIAELRAQAQRIRALRSLSAAEKAERIRALEDQMMLAAGAQTRGSGHVHALRHALEPAGAPQ